MARSSSAGREGSGSRSPGACSSRGAGERAAARCGCALDRGADEEEAEEGAGAPPGWRSAAARGASERSWGARGARRRRAESRTAATRMLARASKVAAREGDGHSRRAVARSPTASAGRRSGVNAERRAAAARPCSAEESVRARHHYAASRGPRRPHRRLRRASARASGDTSCRGRIGAASPSPPGAWPRAGPWCDSGVVQATGPSCGRRGVALASPLRGHRARVLLDQPSSRSIGHAIERIYSICNYAVDVA